MSDQQSQKRHWARRFALQALYQWHITGHSVNELIEQYTADDNWAKVDKDYFVELINACIKDNEQLTEAYSKYIDSDFRIIDPIEKSILLFATYEMLKKNELPSKVIISEAVILCKKFGSVDGYKFINGVLDKLSEARG